MYTSATASRRSRGGVFCVLFFATTMTLAAQSWTVRYDGTALSGVPSEKEMKVVKRIIHSEQLGVSWQPLVRYDNAYDHHARVWSQQVSVWADGDWCLAARELFTWDNSGELYSKTRQNWNGTIWNNLERIRSSFDIDSGDRTLTRYRWENNDWKLVGRSVERFNDERRVESVRDYIWSEDGWRALTLTVRLYNTEGQYSGYEHYELWDNFLDARSEATVAPGGMIGEEVHFTRERDGDWVRSHRDRWTRDSNDQLTDLYVDEWREGAWKEWKWDAYVLAPFTLAAENHAALPAFGMESYPNPTGGSLQVQVRCPEAVTAAVECVDLLGRRLALLPERQFEAGTTVLPLQLDGLPRGLVFLRLVDGATVRSVERILLR